MNPARPAWPLVVVCLAALALSRTDLLSQRADAQSTRERLEDRLLEGELLEVSAGDLDKAMTVYRALVDLTETPEPVRARALLYLARCHRKLGQVERAKEYLDRVIEKHAEERDVLRQARAFLRELGGEKVNPEFDWLSELGKSPEIQARVFDLAMDMVDLDGDAGQRARRQLLALGSVAIPVLEKMVTTSRDERHRHHLAVLLVQMGKLEHWKVLLDPKSPISTRLHGQPRDGRQTSESVLVGALADFFRSIPELSERDRARLLEVLREIPTGEATEPYRKLMLLRVGAVDDFAPAIPALEVLIRYGSYRLGVESLFADRLENDPAAAKAVAERLLDPECRTQNQFYELLEQHAPDVLAVAHHELMLRRVLETIERNEGRIAPMNYSKDSHPLIAKLEAAGAFDTLEGFAQGPLASNLVDYFWKTHVDSGRLAEAPAGWAPILREARPVELRYDIKVADSPGVFPGVLLGTVLVVDSGAKVLHLLAEMNDRFIDELSDFLRKLEEEDPAYRGYGPRVIWPGMTPAWKPSARYVDAMQGLLDAAQPFATIVALEALSLATPLADATLERVEALASKADEDLVREYALYVLVRHFADRPQAGPRVARALMGEALRRLDAKPGNAGASSLTSLATFGSVSPREGSRRSGSRRARTSVTRGSASYPSLPGHLHWTVGDAEQSRDLSIELYPHVVDLTVDEDGRRFHTWYFETCIDDRAAASALLLAKAVEFTDTERKVYALPYLRGLDRALQDHASFLKLIATDAQIETEKRTDAITQAREKSVEWFDWPRFVRTDDPLLEALLDTETGQRVARGVNRRFSEILFAFVPTQDPGWQDAFWTAALESPHARVRLQAYHNYLRERPDALEVFRRGLKDPDEDVRQVARNHILAARTNDMLPLLLVLLEDESKASRLGAVHALKRLALQESVEPLVKALDDPDFEVRKEALEALKAIRATLEEKEEWQKLLEGLKK